MNLFSFGKKSPPGKLFRTGKRPLPPMGEATKTGGYDCYDRDARNPLYDEMLRDPQVAACVAVKKSSLLSGGYDISPGGGSPEDKEAAEFARFALADMEGSVVGMLENVLDAVVKGCSVAEINFKLLERGPYEGFCSLKSVRSKDPARFSFVFDDRGNIKALKDGEGKEYPREKFLIYTNMPRYDSPYGRSDLAAARGAYRSKRALMHFMNMYFEKYGSPTAKGTYRRSLPAASRDEFMEVLKNLQSQSAIVIPEDISLELMQTPRGGEEGLLSAIRFYDKQIAKAILFQTLITDEGANTGSYALAKVHLEVMDKTMAKLRRDMEETVMREQILRPLTEINFRSAACPLFTLKKEEVS
ncbi:MAG: DUF935 family protein [Abditibacteriota bacterium]|nr:DUF935 family protein [Abditibacteriota bacterium]